MKVCQSIDTFLRGHKFNKMQEMGTIGPDFETEFTLFEDLYVFHLF